MLQTILLFAIILLLVLERYAKEGFPSLRAQESIVLDSCALIDGRIVDLVPTGFVSDKLIVPEFIVHELQLLADGSDAHKRERARYGLDIIKQLQNSPACKVEVIPDASSLGLPTDDRLVRLAKKRKASLYTTDYNLSKVASIAGVKILNIHELVQNLRPSALPGERHTVKIIQKGNGSNQGVGYLEDGTMVVVDGAGAMLGKTVEAEVTRTHQTVAGKMLFGKVKSTLKEKKSTTGLPISHRMRSTRTKR